MDTRPTTAIWAADLKKVRREMFIGRVIEERVEFDLYGERLRVPKIKKKIVCGIFPHLVQVRDQDARRDFPVETITYVELLERERKQGGEKDV